MSKDANALLQAMKAAGAEDPAGMIKARLALAKPMVLVMAIEANELTGAERDAAVKQVATVARAMSAEDYATYEKKLAKAVDLTATNFRAIKNANEKSKKGMRDDEPERIAGGWISGHLLELIFDEEKCTTWFAVRYPDGRVEPYVEQITIENRTVAPIWPNSILIKHGVRMPSEIYDRPTTEKELLAITKEHILKYFDFGSNDFFEELAPQFVPFTYFADAFMETTYLRALGDYGTGKTRFLKAVGLICYRPTYITGGSSAASIYHFLDKYRGTLILNEADFGQSDEASIIAKILNGGTERDEGISKMRKDAEGNMEIEMYNVFGPKVIATRRSFDDRAIESRCMTMEMVPFAPDPKIPRHLPSNYEVIAREIRNLWTTYRLFNAQERIEINEADTDYALEARLSQVSGPLMNIIKDDKVKEDLRAFMREYNERSKAERYGTQTARVLEGIMRAWAWGPVSDRPSDELRIYLKDVALATNTITDDMNRRMGDLVEDESRDEDKDKKGKKSGRMTSRGVVSAMQKYLQLRTWRATEGIEDYKGTNYLDMQRDKERIQALCQRWGVEWLETGSLRKLRPNAPPQVDAFKEDREKWQQTGLEEEK